MTSTNLTSPLADRVRIEVEVDGKTRVVELVANGGEKVRFDLELTYGERELPPVDNWRSWEWDGRAEVRLKASGPGGVVKAPVTQGEEKPERTCPRCGSPRWVSVSLDEGWSRRAQCVPCGKVHPDVLGPGWRAA